MDEGELAHLARALDWQSKGDGFDPRILHLIIKRVVIKTTTLFYFKN